MTKGIRTESIHGHEFFDSVTGSFKVPLYLTAVFEHPDPVTGSSRLSDRGFDLKYSREENPSVRALEKVIAKLEGAGDALAFCSGMAAIAAPFLSALQSGDTVVVSKESYGTTQELALDLSRFGVRAKLAGPGTEDFLEKIAKGVRLVIVETLTNPLLRVVDVRSISKRCAEVGARLIVDNTFATPLVYTPLKDGAWISVHSTTKYLAGHNDVIGGALALDGRDDLTELWESRRKLGSIMDPFAAFLTLRGVTTLDVRFRAQCATAQAIAEYLTGHPKVEEVYYPGLSDSEYHQVANRQFSRGLYGGVLSFKVRGGRDDALRVLKSVKVVKAAPSLGGVESLLSYPISSGSKTMSPAVRKELGIGDSLLRFSAGLEDPEDIKDDLSQALARI